MSSSSFISAQLEVVGSEKSPGSTSVFLRVCMAVGAGVVVCGGGHDYGSLV